MTRAWVTRALRKAKYAAKAEYLISQTPCLPEQELARDESACDWKKLGDLDANWTGSHIERVIRASAIVQGNYLLLPVQVSRTRSAGTAMLIRSNGFC